MVTEFIVICEGLKGGLKRHLNIYFYVYVYANIALL